MQEEIREYAGHLRAELQDARHQLDHGRMDKVAFLKRVEVLKRRREAALVEFPRSGALFQQAAAQ